VRLRPWLQPLLLEDSESSFFEISPGRSAIPAGSSDPIRESVVRECLPSVHAEFVSDSAVLNPLVTHLLVAVCAGNESEPTPPLLRRV